MPEPEKYQRDAFDRFYTDPQLARAFAVEAIKMFGSKVIEHFIEPSCGDGALCDALSIAARSDGTTVLKCTAVDLQPSPDMAPNSGLGLMGLRVGDWLELSKQHHGSADLIIANPPFAQPELNPKTNKTRPVAIIQKHVKAMHECLTDGGLCGVLSRQSFLGKPRDTWLSTVARPFKIQQLSPRPSFTGDGKSDGAEYILSWWEMFAGSCHSPKTEFEWLRWK